MRTNRPETPPRVLQLLPADGWRAVYAGADGEPFGETLVCWALVEFHDGEHGPRHDEVYWPAVLWGRQAIVGMTVSLDGSVDSCEGSNNFLGYVPAGEPLDDWRERAQDHIEATRKKLERRS